MVDLMLEKKHVKKSPSDKKIRVKILIYTIFDLSETPLSNTESS